MASIIAGRAHTTHRLARQHGNFAIIGADNTIFAINDANLVVGANGIVAADCGSPHNATITASRE